jgi:chromate transporter
VIAALAVVLNVVGVGPVLVLVIAGVVSASVLTMQNRLVSVVGLQKVSGLPKVVASAMAVAAMGAAFPVGLLRLFLSFLKVGSVVFGSGYVLLAFLQTEFVERLRWLTEKQLIDAVAVGQFTPGPLFTTATFIGYVVAGWMGAAVATVGIFLPGFALVAVSGPLLPQLRRSRVAAVALDGVVAASLALMAVVAWQLGKASIVDWTTLAIFAVSLIALLRFRMNSAWVVAAAAAAGLALR